MRRRGVYLILVVLVVTAVLVVVFARREREPEYGGKKLSEWVRDYGAPRWIWITNGIHVYATPNDSSNQASQSIRGIGSNAIPLLVKWMRYDQAKWKAKAFADLNPWLKRIKSNWQLTDEREHRAEASALVLADFRGDPGPAIPGLTLIMTGRNGLASKRRAQQALKNLGEEGYRVLVANESPNVRLDILKLLARRGMVEEALLPSVIRRLEDPEPEVAAAAAEALGCAALHAPAVVPVLAKSLQDPRAEVRLAAVEALGNYYGKAVSASPALRTMLADTDPRIKEAAERALKHVASVTVSP